MHWFASILRKSYRLYGLCHAFLVWATRLRGGCTGVDQCGASLALNRHYPNFMTPWLAFNVNCLFFLTAIYWKQFIGMGLAMVMMYFLTGKRGTKCSAQVRPRPQGPCNWRSNAGRFVLWSVIALHAWCGWGRPVNFETPQRLVSAPPDAGQSG